MQLSTRTIVIAGVLIAVALVLAFTGLGYFPVPNVTDSATIMHVPAIIGGVLEGPVVGLITGVVFAIDAYIRFGGLFAGAPPYLAFLILLVPRLLIGVVAALVYRALKPTNEIVALVVAAAAGTLTNTVLVLGQAVLFWNQIPFFASIPGLTPAIFVSGAIPQAIFEMILAIIVTVAVVAAWKQIETGRGGSSV